MTRWPIALPFFETADGAGAGAPAVEAPPVAPAADEGGSLADHEAAFVTPPSPDADGAPAAADRRPDGTFKSRERHRAVSQQADTDDIPTINAHTKRIKDAEAKLGADIVKQDGESERAFTLRRRAELLERHAAAPASAAPAPTPAASAPVPSPSAPPAPAAPVGDFDFPEYEQFLETNPNASYKQWELKRFAAFDAWKDSRTNISGLVREALASERARQTMNEAIDQSRTKGRAAYPDFDEVLKSGPGAAVHLHATDEVKAGQRVAAVFRHPQSEHLQHAIMSNGELAKRLASLDDIDFGIELASLVASQRPTSPARSAAAPTGSAPVPERPHVPRPPNPVRTGAMHAADEPPDEGSSLAEHERFYVKSTRH